MTDECADCGHPSARHDHKQDNAPCQVREPVIGLCDCRGYQAPQWRGIR